VLIKVCASGSIASSFHMGCDNGTSLLLVVVMTRLRHNEDVEWLGRYACVDKQRVVGMIEYYKTDTAHGCARV
jgi:hypothetical protein